jgi:hypothetical protein
MQVAQNSVSLTKTARDRGRLPLRAMIGAGILAGSALSLLAAAGAPTGAGDR